jgi:magnesium-protoporphyrin IX monomethyl ester (oxidative) cyclase
MGGFGQLFAPGATFLPPLDLVYLTSYLAEREAPFEVFECLGLELTKELLIEKIASIPGADRGLLVVRTSAPTLDWDLSVCQEIKAAVGNLRILVYGPVVSQVVKRIQQEGCVDYLIKGDPDESVYALAQGQAEPEIPGLSYRGATGWQDNPTQPFIKELDKLPFPKWELLPYEKYRLPKSSTESELSFLPVWSSRGCPIGCHYCPYPVGQGLPWRFRSAMNVVDEIEHLVNDLKIQYILFRDPMFSLNQQRVIQICDEITRRGIQVKWRCETRVDFLKEETLRAMARAGCDGINFGVESADVEIQVKSGRRPIKQEQFLASLALCRELGIKTFAFFIIGLPGDTVEIALKTIRFAVEMKPNWVQFTAASPFIGTKLRDWAIAQGLVEPDDRAYVNSHQVMIGNGNLTKEQVGSLYRLARFLQNFLLNRKGILKDDHRHSAMYRTAKSAADLTSDLAARATLSIAGYWLKRTLATGGSERAA